MSGECLEYKCFSKRVTVLLQTTPEMVSVDPPLLLRVGFCGTRLGARHSQPDDGVKILGVV